VLCTHSLPFNVCFRLKLRMRRVPYMLYRTRRGRRFVLLEVMNAWDFIISGEKDGTRRTVRMHQEVPWEKWLVYLIRSYSCWIGGLGSEVDWVRFVKTTGWGIMLKIKNCFSPSKLHIICLYCYYFLDTKALCSFL